MQCVSNKVETNFTTHIQKVKKREAEENLPAYDTVLIHR
jgi:hypothetical protein